MPNIMILSMERAGLYVRLFAIVLTIYYYSGFGASTGQTSAHAPHSMHSSGSITYLVSPAEMQLTGHSDSQAPQLIHSSLIKYAISCTPPKY